MYIAETRVDVMLELIDRENGFLHWGQVWGFSPV
jgi:hypothetical protein